MKKVNFKNLLTALCFVAAFLLAGAGQASAQAGLADDIYSAPQGSFVGADQAQQIVTDQLTNIKVVLVNLVPGTPSWKAADTAYFFYSSILTELLNGQAVPASIQGGMATFSIDPYGDTSKQDMWNLKTEAIELLSI